MITNTVSPRRMSGFGAIVGLHVLAIVIALGVLAKRVLEMTSEISGSQHTIAPEQSMASFISGLITYAAIDAVAGLVSMTILFLGAKRGQYLTAGQREAGFILTIAAGVLCLPLTLFAIPYLVPAQRSGGWLSLGAFYFRLSIFLGVLAMFITSLASPLATMFSGGIGQQLSAVFLVVGICAAVGALISAVLVLASKSSLGIRVAALVVSLSTAGLSLIGLLETGR